ncbi:MAG: sugar phosphate isomerase/epimerase family protein [Saprospiraceae bacterium]
MKRRNFIRKSSQAALGFGLLGTMNLLNSCTNSEEATQQQSQQAEQTQQVQQEAALFFKLSLAQWSFHNALGIPDASTKTMDHLDFAKKAKELGFEGVEYVNGFFKNKAKDMDYLKQMKQRAADNEIESLLIMIDGEGDLAVKDDANRTKAIENHYKWLEAAHFLGCHSIRVNVFGKGTAEEMAYGAKDALSRLSEFAATENMNVLVENHGGMSSDADWMMKVMNEVNLKNCGMLPDFGNFCVKRDSGKRWDGKCIEEYDIYKGVEMFMPKALAVSAKSHNFDDNGEERKIDYKRMLQIVKDAGYTGYIGVEYEGKEISEEEGVIATRDLLIKHGMELSS